MNEVSLPQFEGQRVRVTPDGKFAAVDVLKAIGQKNPRAAWTALKSQYPVLRFFTPHAFGPGRPAECVDRETLAALLGACMRGRNPRAAAAFALAFDVQVAAVLPVESENIRVLRAVFQDEEPQAQFLCSGYRVDLYLPASNIAIECDEYAHSRYDSQNEARREQVITTALGCKFYRFNPQEPGFNIGQVIYEINKIKEGAHVLAAV